MIKNQSYNFGTNLYNEHLLAVRQVKNLPCIVYRKWKYTLFKNVRNWRKSVRMKIALIYMKSRQSDIIFRQIVVCKFSDARNRSFHLNSKNHEIKWKAFCCEKSQWYESVQFFPFSISVLFFFFFGNPIYVFSDLE